MAARMPAWRPAFAVVIVAAWAAGAGAADPGLLVTVGEASDRAAVVWVRGRTLSPVSVAYARAAGGDELQVKVTLSFAADRTGKATLTGLEPATRYRYRAAQDGEAVDGEFVTAPAPDAETPVTFAWSGDLGSRGHCRRLTEGFPIFRELARVPVDFFLFVGDTIYGDQVCDGPEFVPGNVFVAKTLPQYHAKHRYNRADGPLQDYFRKTGVFAIWDDHEVVNYLSGSVEPRMPIGRQAFIDYFPVVPPREEPGRLYRRVRWGKLLEVFILDTRQYRSANTDPDGPGKTMLGLPQRRWLVEGVSTSTALWKVVVTSVSLSVPTGRKSRDSWSNANVWGFPEEGSTGFAVERDSILGELRARGVKNLVFLAADLHHAELIHHRPMPEWSFYEFIAGPLSAGLGRPRPLDQALGPKTLFAFGGGYNFGVIRIERGTLGVRIVDAAGQERGSHTTAPER
jgi:alkaline phosphatase D